MTNEAEGPSTPATRPSYRVLRHQMLAKILELVLTPVDITVESELQVMSEPPRADLLLLRRHGDVWSEAQRKLLPDGVRDRQAHHHLLECKFTESVNEEALQQTLSYDFFYRRTQQLTPAELQTYVVSAKTPRGAMLAQYGYVQSERPGVYVTEQPLLRKVVLLVLNELSSEPQNEFLRLFASQQRVRKQTLDEVLQDPVTLESESLLAAVFGLQRLYQMEDEAMTQELTVDDVMAIGDKLRKQAIASASVKERLAGLAPEERLAGLAPEERLAGLAPEERLAGLAPEERLAGLAPEERLAGLAPEEMERLQKQLESLLAQQKAEQPRHRKPTSKK